jgi:hypothetical protein
MSINPADFRRHVIEPAQSVLVPAGIPASKVAADLMMATAAAETLGGTWLSQMNNGPGLGVFNIEGQSLLNLIDTLTPEQRGALATVATPQAPEIQIESNLLYAAVVCRLFYWHDPMALPPDTKSGLWSMYKAVWNTDAGATTEAEFLSRLSVTDLGSLPD